MKNKSGKTSGQPKGKSATRSAGKQATGNRNKHLLAAERRRTDEPHGRLNKQNPVSPQNRTPNNERTELSKTQAKVKAQREFLNEAIKELEILRVYCRKKGYGEIDERCYDIERLVYKGLFKTYLTR